MKVLLLKNTDLRSGTRLDFAFNVQVKQNQKLASSRYDWKRLDELSADICDGPRQVDVADEGISYIRIGDLKVGDVAAVGTIFVSGQHAKERFRLQNNDVLFSKTSDEPRAALIPARLTGATFSSDIFRLRIDPKKISPAWVSLFFNTKYATKVFSQRAYGTRIKRLRVADLRNIRIPIPPFNLAQEVELLEQQAQEYSAIAQDTFTAVINGLHGEIDTRIGNQLTASQEKWLQASNKWLTYRWDVSYVRSYHLMEALRQTGLFEPVSKLAQLAVSSRKHLDPEQRICFVNVSDIEPQYFTFSQTHQEQLNELSNRIRLPLQAGQVLVLASGSNLGSKDHPVAVVEPELDGCLTSNAFIALEFSETPIYFGLVMRHPLVLAQIRSLASGSAVQQTLKKQDFKTLLLPVLGGIWRQDYNARASIAWEKRRLAIDLRQQAIEKVEAFVSEALGE